MLDVPNDAIENLGSFNVCPIVDWVAFNRRLRLPLIVDDLINVRAKPVHRDTRPILRLAGLL